MDKMNGAWEAKREKDGIGESTHETVSHTHI